MDSPGTAVFGSAAFEIPHDGLTHRWDYDTTSGVVYHARAKPGTATSAASWWIEKLTLDSRGRPTIRQHAGGTNNFAHVYDNRATTVTYS